MDGVLVSVCLSEFQITMPVNAPGTCPKEHDRTNRSAILAALAERGSCVRFRKYAAMS
jgi:hypothetical protein